MKKCILMGGLFVLFSGWVSGIEPVTYYNFNNPGDLGKDSAGSFDLTANTAVGTAPTYATGALGGGASFADNNSYVSPAGIYPNGSFSFAAWVKPADTNVNELTSPPSSRGGFQIYAANGNWRVRVNKSDNTLSYRIGNAVTTNWTHIAVTFTKSSGPDANNNYTGYLRLYMDGVYVTGVNGAVYCANNTYTMTIGSKSTLGLYRGLVDEFLIYNDVLTVAEIEKLAVRNKIKLVVITN